LTVRRPHLFVLDATGEPLAVDDVRAWGMWYESAGVSRIVEQTHVEQYFVSTVFLGIDHQWGDGLPLLWETMVFDDSRAGMDKRLDVDCHRYSSRADALAGHQTTVQLVRLHVERQQQSKLGH
jgi:hypothetical protein